MAGRENGFALSGLTRRSKKVKAHRAQEGTTCGGTPHDPGHVYITMVLIEVHALGLLLLTSGPGQITLKYPLIAKVGLLGPVGSIALCLLKPITEAPAFSEKALRGAGQPSKSMWGWFFSFP